MQAFFGFSLLTQMHSNKQFGNCVSIDPISFEKRFRILPEEF